MVKLNIEGGKNKSRVTECHQHHRVPTPGECIPRNGKMEVDRTIHCSYGCGLLPPTPPTTGDRIRKAVSDCCSWWGGVKFIDPAPRDTPVEGQPSTTTGQITGWPEGDPDFASGLLDENGVPVFSGGE